MTGDQVAAFQCLQPFFGTVLSFLFLGERPTAWDLGGIAVISGLLLVTSDGKELAGAGAGSRSRDVALPPLPTTARPKGLHPAPGWHHQRYA